jgi:glycosyltransferase involved in cell wall biosynthesis
MIPAMNPPVDIAETNPGCDNVRRLAYLLSIYPAISHTFLLNEIMELRKKGFVIDVASINKPRWERGTLSDSVADALGKTFYVKNGKPLQTCLLLLKVLVTRPFVVCRGLRGAWQLQSRNAAGVLYSLFYLAEALIVGEWLRSRGHSHLHIHFGGPVATVGMLASIAWRIPYSITIHGPDEFYGVETFCLRQKIQRAQFVLCISDYCRSQIMKLSEPERWNKLHLLRLGVDTQLFQPAPKKGAGHTLELICVGRLVADKGHLVLLGAFYRLLSRGHKIRLRIIGDGTERRNLESFVRQNGLGDSVTLEGALSHESTRQLLARADIFVLASFAEGLPVALMEAMAMEVACVSTYIAGIPELIRSEVDGVLVPASSEDGLVEALERLIMDSDLRHSLACSGRQRILELYRLDTNIGLLAATLGAQLEQMPSSGRGIAAPSYVPLVQVTSDNVGAWRASNMSLFKLLAGITCCLEMYRGIMYRC